ncbi:MAG: hypothetical protein JSS79_07700 [Bacteroidetes bacterium]|nr:hypothetical protein [Bacteroidota bacterium]
MQPFIETHRQITTNYFIDDVEARNLADTLVKKELNKLVYKRLPSTTIKLDLDDLSKTKFKVDSFINKLPRAQSNKLLLDWHLNSKSNLALIPYFIWTRTTKEYDDGTCSHDAGRNYFSNQHCYWSRAQAYVFLIDRKNNEILYFKSNQWYFEDILLPFEKRVSLSLKRCMRPLLSKLGRQVANNSVMQNHKDVISGVAKNAKGGAVVVTSQNQVYYIDKKDSWGAEYLDKNVSVEGIVIIKEVKKHSKEVISTEMEGPSLR